MSRSPASRAYDGELAVPRARAGPPRSAPPGSTSWAADQTSDKRRAAAGVVPDTGRDDPARPGHPAHVAQPGHRIGHEVHDQLGQCGVEGPVVVREGLGRALPDVQLGEARAGGRDERLRGVDGRDRGRAVAVDEDRREHARAAADVEHLPGDEDVGAREELPGERLGPPAHEAQIGVSRDVEAHGPVGPPLRPTRTRGGGGRRTSLPPSSTRARNAPRAAAPSSRPRGRCPRRGTRWSR